MVISEVIKELKKLKKKHGDVTVMGQDMRESGTVWEVTGISFEEVLNDDEYPKDWNMPKGFKFVVVHSI